MILLMWFVGHLLHPSGALFFHPPSALLALVPTVEHCYGVKFISILAAEGDLDSRSRRRSRGSILDSQFSILAIKDHPAPRIIS